MQEAPQRWNGGWGEADLLTSQEDVPGQVAQGCGSRFQLEVDPGEQAPLKGPEERQQHLPAVSATAGSHQCLTLGERGRASISPSTTGVQ